VVLSSGGMGSRGNVLVRRRCLSLSLLSGTLVVGRGAAGIAQHVEGITGSLISAGSYSRQVEGLLSCQGRTASELFLKLTFEIGIIKLSSVEVVRHGEKLCVHFLVLRFNQYDLLPVNSEATRLDIVLRRVKARDAREKSQSQTFNSKMNEEFCAAGFFLKPSKTPPFVKDQNFVRARTLCLRRTGTKRT
jgi:hypothetical protein